MFDFHAHNGECNDDAFISLVTAEDLSFTGKSNTKIALGYMPWLENHISLDRFLSLLEENSDWNVGEVGLDKRFFSPDHKDELEEILSSSIVRERIVLIHSVRYNQMILDMLRKHKIRKAIFHSYTSSYEEALKIANASYFISLSPLSFRTRDIKKLVTLPFLLESDMKTSKEEKEKIKMLYEKASRMLDEDVSGKMEMRKNELWTSV